MARLDVAGYLLWLIFHPDLWILWLHRLRRLFFAILTKVLAMVLDAGPVARLRQRTQTRRRWALGWPFSWFLQSTWSLSRSLLVHLFHLSFPLQSFVSHAPKQPQILWVLFFHTADVLHRRSNRTRHSLATIFQDEWLCRRCGTLRNLLRFVRVYWWVVRNLVLFSIPARPCRTFHL